MLSARVRLGGIGSSAKEGYVEAKGTNGVWGGICSKKFDLRDGHVVCRMLGFPFATGIANDLYGTAPSGNNFVLDGLGCTGNEESIFDCQHKGEWNENCKAKDIAGVQCNTSKL